MKTLKHLLKLVCLVVGSLAALVVLMVRPRMLDAFSPNQKVLFDRLIKNSNNRR